MIVTKMIGFFSLASDAQIMGISAPDPKIFKSEALKYAQMFGDSDLYVYNKHINS